MPPGQAHGHDTSWICDCWPTNLGGFFSGYFCGDPKNNTVSLPYRRCSEHTGKIKINELEGLNVHSFLGKRR